MTSDHLSAKIAAMGCFSSQVREFPNPRSSRGIEALAQVRGATVQVPAAEAFCLVREID